MSDNFPRGVYDWGDVRVQHPPKVIETNDSVLIEGVYGYVVEPSGWTRKAALIVFPEEKAHICLDPGNLSWDVDSQVWRYVGTAKVFPWRAPAKHVGEWCLDCIGIDDYDYFCDKPLGHTDAHEGNAHTGNDRKTWPQADAIGPAIWRQFGVG